jgi:hypothetical protein
MSGDYFDRTTAGGGRIKLNLDALILKQRANNKPTIEANGWPQTVGGSSSMKMGGSGGTVSIKTVNQI